MPNCRVIKYFFFSNYYLTKNMFTAKQKNMKLIL